MHFRLGEILKAKGLNAYRLSSLLDGGSGRAAGCRLVAGSKATLSPAEVAHLCEVLRVSPNELFGYKATRGGKG